MMKRSIKLLVAAFLSFATLSACNKGDAQQALDNLAVTSVTLDEEYKVLDVDDSFQLTATVTLKEGKEEAKYEVEWRSSNSRVADVNKDGLVTALSSGSATISYIAGYKMASCTVYVPGSGESSGGGSGGSGGGGEVTPTPDPSGGGGEGGGETPIVPPTPTDPEGEDDDEDKQCTVYFFIDYNNIDENDKTGTKLLAKFKWYGDRPISESGLVPANPTTPMDPAFPYFIGWSNHTIVDTKDDLWDINNSVIGNGYYFYLYGIWSDVSGGEFVR